MFLWFSLGPWKRYIVNSTVSTLIFISALLSDLTRFRILRASELHSYSLLTTSPSTHTGVSKHLFYTPKILGQATSVHKRLQLKPLSFWNFSTVILPRYIKEHLDYSLLPCYLTLSPLAPNLYPFPTNCCLLS